MSTDAKTQQRRVLVVDDDPVARLLASQALIEMGFVADEAEDGREALEKIEAGAPDLVILDLEMPGLNGFEVCEAIRASERTRELPVLIATGFTDSETIDRAYDVGATDFLKKPIDLSILRHHVRFVMRANDAFNELRLALSELEASDKRLESAQQLAHLGHWQWTAEADEMLWSGETFRILGFEPHSVQPTLEAFMQATHPEDRANLEKQLQRSAVEREDWTLDHRILTQRGETRVVQQRATLSTEVAGTCLSGTIQDITESRRAEDQINFLVHFDGRTGLPNRSMLCERLGHLLADSADSNEVVGVIRLDLDRFRRVNDTLGLEVGDDLLRSIARRLQTCVRATDLIAKYENEACAISSLGGDEFSIILPKVRTPEDLSYVSRRVLESFRLPFMADGHEIELSASLGIAMFPDDGDNAEELLRNAGNAITNAKRDGGGTFHFFDASMNERASRIMQIEMGLQSAIELGEFRLVYQPQFDAKTERVVGMEALLRWRSDKLGDVSPGEFIPVAESANLIQRIGEWVFEESCRQLQRWQRQGLVLVPLAVNFSSRQLRAATVADLVTGVMRKYEIDPSLIEVEMTESAFVGDIDKVMNVLSSLKATGVRIALDDFGTGYSSLSHLAHFPIDVLKVDQSFVFRIGEDEQVSTLVSALIAMARRLGLTVVAEGVETEGQADFLRGESCDILQGFALARPLEVDDATELLISEQQKS